jgi:uncharacterized SAM-binding protein YcdF (DUF218 family)
MLPTQDSLGTEIAVVLGSGLNQDGTPTAATIKRAEAAAELAISRPGMTIILSGCRAANDLGTHGKTEAGAMEKILVGHGIAKERIILEPDSQDTLGNAVFVVARFLHGKRPRPLFIVTSPFHAPRSLDVFAHVLGPDWLSLTSYNSQKAPDDDVRASKEKSALENARTFFAGVELGDISGCITRLKEQHALYKSLTWLLEWQLPQV